MDTRIDLRTAPQTTNSHEYTPMTACWREDGSHLLGEGNPQAQREIPSCSLVSIRGSIAVLGVKRISRAVFLLFLTGAISAGWAADPPTPVPASQSGAGNRGLKANQRAHPPSGMALDERTTTGTVRPSGEPDPLRRRPLPPLPTPSVPKPKPAPGEIPDVAPGLILKALDLNHDDALTSTELRNVPALFKKLDTNGDGVIRWDLTGAEPKRKRGCILRSCKTGKKGGIHSVRSLTETCA